MRVVSLRDQYRHAEFRVSGGEDFVRERKNRLDFWSYKWITIDTGLWSLFYPCSETATSR